MIKILLGFFLLLLLGCSSSTNVAGNSSGSNVGNPAICATIIAPKTMRQDSLQVDLYTYNSETSQSTLVTTKSTDDTGAVSFTELESGVYRLYSRSKNDSLACLSVLVQFDSSDINLEDTLGLTGAIEVLVESSAQGEIGIPASPFQSSFGKQSKSVATITNIPIGVYNFYYESDGVVQTLDSIAIETDSVTTVDPLHNLWPIGQDSIPLLKNRTISALQFGANGVLYGAFNDGILKSENGQSDMYLMANYLSRAVSVTSVAIDATSGLGWFGTSAGIMKEEGGNRFTLTSVHNNEMRDSIVTTILYSSVDSSVWAGTASGIVRLKNDTTTIFDVSKLPVETCEVRNSVNGPDGMLWFGTLGSGLLGYKDGLWVTKNTSNSALKSDFIMALAQDNNGGTWVATSKELIRMDSDGMQQVSTPFAPAAIRFLSYQENSQELWCGTFDALYYYTGTAWHLFASVDEYTGQWLHSLAFDSNGNGVAGAYEYLYDIHR